MLSLEELELLEQEELGTAASASTILGFESQLSLTIAPSKDPSTIFN
jgi:hypothetical protein